MLCIGSFSLLLSQTVLNDDLILTKNWYDGSAMNDKKVDGNIYKKSSSGYFVDKDFFYNREVNVLKFGAVANSSSLGSGTDQSKHFQAALDFLKSVGGGKLIVPSGWYLIQNTLKVYDFIEISGIASNVIEWKIESKPGTTLVFDFVGVGIQNANKDETCFFSGMNNLNLYTTKETQLVDLSRIQFSTFYKITFSGMRDKVTKNGIGITGKNDGTSNNFLNCNFQNLNFGIKNLSELGKPFDDNNFVNCRFEVNNVGINLVGDSDSNKFSNCSFAYNLNDIRLEDSQSNYFVNCRIEGTTGTSISIDSKSSNNKFVIASFIKNRVRHVVDDGINNSFDFANDVTHYSTPLDMYPAYKNSGWTKQTATNYIMDSYSMTNNFTEYGQIKSKSYLTETFEGSRILRLTNSSQLSYFSLKPNPRIFKDIKAGDEFVMSIWVRSKDNLNQILRSLIQTGENVDLEIASSYQHIRDDEFHLCSLTFRIPKNINVRSKLPFYLRLYLPANSIVDISKPTLYKGSMNFNGESDTFEKQRLNVYNSLELPVLTESDKGVSVYNSTLEKPIWWNGIEWKDCNGNKINVNN